MEHVNFEKENEGRRNGKTTALVLGALVYAGVIVISVVLTSMFITSILPANQYSLRLLVTLGVCAVGLNAIALPVALHFWAVTGTHRALALVCYGLDMLVIAVNLVTSFSTLSGNPPGWVQQYAPYSVGMFVFALATWGVLWMTDPGERASTEMHKAAQEFRVQAMRQAAEYLQSTEGRRAIAQGAQHLIPALFDPDQLKDTPRSWYGRDGTSAQNVPSLVPSPDGTRAEGVPSLPPFRGNGHK